MNINIDTEMPKQILIGLNKGNSSIDDISHRLKELYGALDNNWADNYRDGFNEKFNKYMKLLEAFKETTTITTAKLNKIIEALDEYENIKIEI